MGPLGREAWAQRLGAFRASPSAFLAGAEGEDLGRDLLSDLRSEKLSEQTKVSLLTLSLEYSDKLWPDAPAAEAAATSLLDTLVLLPTRPSALRRLLLLAATTALVSGDALGPTSGASCRLLPLLLGLASGRDLGRSFGTPSEQRHLQATACECLGELERCKPGLLAGALGMLRSLPGQTGPIQPVSLLLALRGLRGQPPVLFKPQLVRLLGTAQLTLLHSVLSLKAAFGEALFTAQDEALLLRRLTLGAQHPALPSPTHLFYLHCILSFPENCPLGPEGEEAAPLLLGPQLCRGLMPSLLHDPTVLLARLHLLCLLCADDEEEEKDQTQGPQWFLQEVLAGLQQRAALDGGPRALATLCFQASYLVTNCLTRHSTVQTFLIRGLAQLYRARPSLAPHFVDLLDQVQALDAPVYSLELRFRVEGQLYEPLEAVHIPCLRPGQPAHPLYLLLQPRCPAPARLHVRALYSTSAGLTCHARLPPLSVNFADLFLPFPRLPKGSELRFFDELWNSCLPKGVESRVWCPLGQQGLEALVSQYLEPFVVLAQPPTTYLIAIRLPPASMLLLRLEKAQVDGVPVALRTDDWAVLPLVGDYLRGLAAH